MSSRIERSNVICIDPHSGKRLEGSGLEIPLRMFEIRRTAQQGIEKYNNEIALKRVAVYLGLALGLTCFWGGLIWLWTR